MATATLTIIRNERAPLCDQELYIAEHGDAGELGVGMLDELLALSDDGILPPRETLTFRQITKLAA